MPTPDEVDAAGVYGPMDVGGRLATVARWQSETYEGRPILPGRWYHLLSADHFTSYGMIECSTGEFFAFRPYEVGEGLGDVCSSLNEAIRLLAADGPP